MNLTSYIAEDGNGEYAKIVITIEDGGLKCNVSISNLVLESCTPAQAILVAVRNIHNAIKKLEQARSSNPERSQSETE